MRAHILEQLNDLKIKSGKSLEAIHEALGFSTSAVSRWLKGETEPDLEQLTRLVEYFGGSMQDLFAAVGQSEMAATQAIGYQGAEAMVEHYEARLAAKDEMYAQLQVHHTQRITEINANHERSVEYLKSEIVRLRAERDEARQSAAHAQEAARAITGKKHIVYWVLAGIDALMAIALILALMTDSVL